MSDQDPVPPDTPRYTHSDTAGRAESFTDEGARWLWTGSSWELIDPPDTHTHTETIRSRRVVLPLMNRVIALARSTTDLEAAVNEISSMEDCNRSTLDQIRLVLEAGDDSLHRTAAILYGRCFAAPRADK